VVDDDWVWIGNRNGRVKGQVKLISGVNKNTVWTWNAIGKRKGAWGLKHDSDEFTKGFLLNHIISDVLASGFKDKKYANADPVTGQAAWYDLRVSLTKCEQIDCGYTEPMFAAFNNAPVCDDKTLRYGADICGEDSGGQIPIKEFVGQRGANSECIDGIRKGHGNRIDE